MKEKQIGMNCQEEVWTCSTSLWIEQFQFITLRLACASSTVASTSRRWLTSFLLSALCLFGVFLSPLLPDNLTKINKCYCFFSPALMHPVEYFESCLTQGSCLITINKEAWSWRGANDLWWCVHCNCTKDVDWRWIHCCLLVSRKRENK